MSESIRVYDQLFRDLDRVSACYLMFSSLFVYLFLFLHPPISQTKKQIDKAVAEYKASVGEVQQWNEAQLKEIEASVETKYACSTSFRLLFSIHPRFSLYMTTL